MNSLSSNPPFLGLRALLAALFGGPPVARFVDPLLGDLHAEHAAAASAAERRQVRLRGALLLLRVLPSVVARATSTSFASLTLPLVSLASLGILAIAREPSVASYARLQALWLVVALVAAGMFGWLARTASRRAATISVGVAAILSASALVPGIARVVDTHVYLQVGVSVEPLKLAWPFLLVGLVAVEGARKSAALAVIVFLGAVATARGALGDAVFAWSAAALLLSERSWRYKLLAPGGLVATLLVHGQRAPLGNLDPRTDGILDTISAHGGTFGVLLSAGFIAWTIGALKRGSTRHLRVARMLGFAFAGTTVLSVLALLGDLPPATSTIAGLSYGGSALFMLLGAAGALAGANVDTAPASRSVA